MIKYGELTTKKANRNTFIKILTKNIERVLKDYPVTIKKDRVRMYITCQDEQPVINALQKIFGLHSIVLCEKVNTNIDDISKKAIELVKILKLLRLKQKDL